MQVKGVEIRKVAGPLLVEAAGICCDGLPKDQAGTALTVLHCSWTSSCVVAVIEVLDTSYKRLPLCLVSDCCTRLSPVLTMRMRSTQ